MRSNNVYRGCSSSKVSLLTILTMSGIYEWPEGLLCLFELHHIMHFVCVIYMVYFVFYWDRTGGSKPSCGTEGFPLRQDRRLQTELWDQGVLTETHDRRVHTETHETGGSISSYSHERLIICVCGILGNSLSFVLTLLCDMCFRFSQDREKAPTWLYTH